MWPFGAGKGEMSVTVHSRFIVNTAEAAIDAAIAGAGLTRVLSYQIRNALRAGLLAVTLQDFEPAPWPISLVHAGGRLLPLKLRAFLDFSLPRLKGGLLQETT
jgi:DNA-binding transcriptional LysR family regulator